MTFSAFVTQHEIGIRLAFFTVIFMLMAIWELVLPRGSLTASKVVRWTCAKAGIKERALYSINNVIMLIIFIVLPSLSLEYFATEST